jgi:hypothetical protein
MATYYWIGASGSDVNSRFNWSLYGTNVTTPPPAPTKPALNSDIIFEKWPSTYPVNIPMGFLHFGNTAGATALALNTVTVKPNYNLDLGRGGTLSAAGNCYFGFFAKTISLSCNNPNSNSKLKRFLNLYDGSGILGQPLNSNVRLGATGYQDVYINGNISYLNTLGSSLPLRSTVYFNGATSNGSGGTMSAVNFDGPANDTLINISNPKSRDTFNFTNEVTFSEGSILEFSGEENIINLEGGVQWGEVAILVATEAPTSLSQINLTNSRTDELCYSANPPSVCFTPSAIKTIKLNAVTVNLNNPYPKLNVEHGCILGQLRLEKGEVILNAKTDQAFYVRGGYMNPSTSIMKDITGCLEIQDNESFSDGFVFKNQPDVQPSTNLRADLNYNVRMIPTDPGYSYGIE